MIFFTLRFSCHRKLRGRLGSPFMVREFQCQTKKALSRKPLRDRALGTLRGRMGDLVMSGWCLALSNERLKLKQMYESTRTGVLKKSGGVAKAFRAAPVPERRTSTPVETVLRDGSLGRTRHHSRAGLIENKQNYSHLGGSYEVSSAS